MLYYVKILDGGIDMAGSYTAADYFSLVPEGTNKWELIKGFFEMSPSPLTEHQRISQDMSRIMGNYFLLSKCMVFVAPFDVQLGDNVVQPDIVLICDKTKLVERGCKGAPDLIVEIISPSTRLLDETTKKIALRGVPGSGTLVGDASRLHCPRGNEVRDILADCVIVRVFVQIG